MGVFAFENMKVSHFRSHKKTSIKFSPGPMVFYGPNGAGKTNILEAVSLFSPGRGLRNAPTLDLVRQPEEIGWKVSTRFKNFEDVYDLDTWSSGGSLRRLLIDDKKQNQVVLGKLVRMLWITPLMDRLWVEGASERRRFLDRLVLSLDPEHAENSINYNRALKERNRLIKDRSQDQSWFNVLELQMAQSGMALDKARRQVISKLSSANFELGDLFPVAKLKLIGPQFENVDEFLSALKNNRKKDIMAGRTLLGPHKSDLQAVHKQKELEAKNCSTGEQKVLLLSIVLANARVQIGEFKAAPILLFDEVCAHLDEERRNLLYDEICSLGAQVFLTGTDLDVFNGIKGRAQFFKVESFKGETHLTET